MIEYANPADEPHNLVHAASSSLVRLDLVVDCPLVISVSDRSSSAHKT